MKEVYEFLKQCEYYFLATLDGKQPRVRPFGTVDMFEGRIYIQTGKIKSVAKQMKVNPKIEICAMSKDGRWIRLAAEAVFDDNVEAQIHMLDAYPNLKEMYKAGDGNTEVYFLKNATAQIFSFFDAPKTITF